MPDDAAAMLARLREEALQIASLLVPALDATQAYRAGAFTDCAWRAFAAAEAALRHHQPVPLYGNASTEDEPGACPHDPDAGCHFESDDGEWLCELKREGTACSCTESADGERIPWPCDEVTDILAALTGNEAP